MTTLFAEYREKNHAALAPVAKALEAMGFEVVLQDMALRCELKFGEAVAGYAFFVSAEFVFSLDKQPLYEDEDEIDREHREKGRRYFEVDFRRFQRDLMEEVRQKKPIPECYLFVIGEEVELLSVNSKKLLLVESDESYARKYVQTMAQAKVMLTSQFPSHNVGAARPTFDTVSELIYLNEDAPEVDAVLTYAGIRKTPDAQTLCLEDSADIRTCIEGIFWRIAGPSYKIFWTPDDVCIGRIWDSRGIPLDFAGEGAQKLFAFACFLATEASKLQPGQRIGLYGVLNGLCVLWYIGAIDVLRQFSYATGVSVRLQIPQRDRRDSAKYRMKQVATVLDVARYPYD